MFNQKNRSKKRKITIFCVLFLFGAFSIGTILYVENRSINFGSMNTSVSLRRLKHECCRNINTKGLAELNAYGSGIVNYHHFKSYFENMIDNSPQKLQMVNLLGELYYYKNRSLHWYGLGYTDHNFGKLLYPRRPIRAGYRKLISTVCGAPPMHDTTQFQTEHQIIEQLGGNYHMPLKGVGDWLKNAQFIEDTIRFFESLSQDTHLYVHCYHGRGRTTTYLILYDIFRNRKEVPLVDIVSRHFCLGRENVFDTKLWSKGTWTQKDLDAREDLVKKFYAYMTDPKGYGHKSWSQWNASIYPS